jgi:glyoxylase-like metal-dependent hydrolase (beta-lactamase superfamily II)
MMNEIVPGLIRLEEIDGTRLLCQFLLYSDEQLTIVDAGLPSSPFSTIVPAIEELSLERPHITLVLTHPDADHCGGTASLRAAYPGLRTLAHEFDVPPLGNPGGTIAHRYEAFAQTDGLRMDRLARARATARFGAEFEVDERITGETWFDQGDARAAIVHIPGHSDGHVGIWLPETRTLIAGDALMGYGIRNCDGSLLYPPQFFSRALYEATLDRVEAMDVDILLCAHEAPMSGAAVATFIDDSREAVRILEADVVNALRTGQETLGDLCQSVSTTYPGFSPDRWMDLAPSVSALLLDMQTSGIVAVNDASGIRHFSFAADSAT